MKIFISVNNQSVQSFKMLKTLFKNHRRFVGFFQLYGVVTTRSKLSIGWTLITLVLAFVTLLKAATLQLFSPQNLQSISAKSFAVAFSLVSTVRILAVVGSLLNAGKCEKILDDIEAFDKLMLKRFNVDVNTNWKYFELTAKFISIASITFAILAGNFVFLPTSGNKIFWLLTLSTVHVVHMKELSFVFFVDLINYRLESLHLIKGPDRHLQMLKFYSKLFDVSKLINESQSHLITVLILQQCSGFFLNFFWLFAIILKTQIEFVKGIYRKSIPHSLTTPLSLSPLLSPHLPLILPRPFALTPSLPSPLPSS